MDEVREFVRFVQENTGYGDRMEWLLEWLDEWEAMN